MKSLKAIFLLWVMTMAVSVEAVMASNPPEKKPRIIITADPELDDNNSLIRFLLYSTDFRVEGLIYASSQFHWKGDGKGTTWYVPNREYGRVGMTQPMTSCRYVPEERFIHEMPRCIKTSRYITLGILPLSTYYPKSVKAMLPLMGISPKIPQAQSLSSSVYLMKMIAPYIFKHGEGLAPLPAH